MKRTVTCVVLILFVATGSRTTRARAAEPDTAPATQPDTPARRTFERIKQLAGDWQGKSTRGWEERTTFKVIAGESAVMYTSFDAHPGQTMLTVFHMDGAHLMLTHYCVARNQPRLRATEFADDGSSVTFTFLDATNLASRDKGHMDKAVYRFTGDGAFTTQWTWYQNGQERWMEEIEMRRVEANAEK